jgi:predicted dehydrogenase
MLDGQELDAAYVCVPPHAHGGIELALIERRIPFFLEKPLGNERGTPRRILEALEGRDLITSVGYMMRYHETAQRVRELLARQQPVVARGAWLGGIPGVHWWRRKDRSGGQIVEQSTHIYDLARYLFGEVESVFCVGRRGLVTDVEGYDVEDASVCVLRFEDGLVCEISSSCAVGRKEVSLEVFTGEARAKLTGGALELTLETAEETRQMASTDDVFLKEDRAFVDAVLGGDASAIRSPYADAFRTQMVTCAANESMESGQPVEP